VCIYINELKKNNYKKSSIKEIAKKYNRKESELKRYFLSRFFKDIANEVNLLELADKNIENIKEYLKDDELIKEFEFIKNDLKKILQKSLYIALNNGWIININHIDSGVMTANAGDSAEFIFVARAILAGFNASSVDVRSSRYDAIIDNDGKLLRVQVKGISTGNTISFKDRDRGGQGIDYTHERNRGKRITSKDCDIYVAVDKQVGICYIIPMSWADKLSDDECKSINISKIQEFKENWDIIKAL
jgi:hypothetical protein